MGKKDLEKDDFSMGLFPSRPIKVWVGVEFPNGMKRNKLSRLVLGDGDDEIYLDIKFPKEITNEIRKKICDEIRKLACPQYIEYGDYCIECLFRSDFESILDQIEKGEE